MFPFVSDFLYLNYCRVKCVKYQSKKKKIPVYLFLYYGINYIVEARKVLCSLSI